MGLYQGDKPLSGGKSPAAYAKDAGYTGTDDAFYTALADMPDHVSDQENPHGTTASQVGAYTKDEVSTLLAKKAPAGFGYGETCESMPETITTDEELDEWLIEMFAKTPLGGTKQIRFKIHSLAYTTTWIGVIRNSGVTGGYGTITAYSYSNFYAPFLTCVHRNIRNNIPLEWEWENPTMSTGVEYRTTERYLGKPVYKRMIDFGTLPSSGSKEVSVPNADNVMRNISIDLSKSVCTKTGFLNTNLFPSHPSISAIYFNQGTVRIETTADYSSWSAQICISYTKSTD